MKFTALWPLVIATLLAGTQANAQSPDTGMPPGAKRDRDLEVRPRGQREEAAPPRGDDYSTEEPDGDDDEEAVPDAPPSASKRL
jgi:hypothetical protein